MKQPSFNVEGSKLAAYCKQHPEGSMVNAYSRRCSYFACTKPPRYNVKESKIATYFNQHAADDIVDVRARCC